MNKKFFFYLVIVLLSAGCKNNIVKISGTVVNQASGEYIFLDELRSNNLVPIDSVKISDDGSFSFKKEIKQTSFYLLKSKENNFLTMLLEPGEKITMKVHSDSLNYPISLKGSRGTELMAEYNKTLRITIIKLTELNSIYNQNKDKPELPRVIETLDSLAQIYLGEINTYTKKYIDDNLTSLVSLVAVYQQVAPSVYVLNPTKDMKYFLKEK